MFHSLRRGGATFFFKAASSARDTSEKGAVELCADWRVYPTEGLAASGLQRLLLAINQEAHEWSQLLVLHGDTLLGFWQHRSTEKEIG